MNNHGLRQAYSAMMAPTGIEFELTKRGGGDVKIVFHDENRIQIHQEEASRVYLTKRKRRASGKPKVILQHRVGTSAPFNPFHVDFSHLDMLVAADVSYDPANGDVCCGAIQWTQGLEVGAGGNGFNENLGIQVANYQFHGELPIIFKKVDGVNPEMTWLADCIRFIQKKTSGHKLKIGMITDSEFDKVKEINEGVEEILPGFGLPPGFELIYATSDLDCGSYLPNGLMKVVDNLSKNGRRQHYGQAPTGS